MSPRTGTARRLRTAPSAAEILAADIQEICAQIDRRLGNPPGTAARGCYWHLWPPGGHSTDVLTALHRDALRFLLDLTQPERNPE